MRFEVLGPVRGFRGDQELPLGGPQQRLVLALLIAAGGQTVPTGRLIDGVWGEEPPATAKKALQGYVHHLRSAIGHVLVTERGGYSIQFDDNVDAVEFERLQRDGSEVLAVDPRRAAEVLTESLALWNGPAYADLADELALMPERTRLDDLRVLALGDLVDAELALGRHAALIGQLEALTQEHPLHERFRAQHMTALYRAGRQVEALRAYEHLRRYLLDEMGLQPSADLQVLEQRILAQDPDLLAPIESDEGAPAVVRGYELRELVASGPLGQTYRAYQRSVGRQMAVRVLSSDIADDPEFIAHFITDTKAIAALDHPHICFVVDTWREPGRAFRVSRWLGGGSLDDAVRAGTMGLNSAMQMLDQVGRALDHAHRNGVVHGQVSPSHVLFDESGSAYLTEFTIGRPASSVDAARDRRDLALLAHFALTGHDPRVIDGVLVPNLNGIGIATTATPVFELAFSPDGYRRVEDFLRALRQAAGLDTIAPPDRSGLPRRDVRNPYKGLRAFQENDAADFFGRDDVVETVIDQLSRHRLVFVVGPSGAGKSSLVKAGVLPRLRSLSDGRPLLISEMYPGRYPFEELEDALLRVGVDRESVIEDLLGDERGLTRVLKQILPSDDAELVLVIDQFEELFSMVANEDVRRLFLNGLAAATADSRSRLRVIATMRADFFDRPLEYPEFGASLNAGLVPITVPGDEQLASAIVEPARSVGIEYEPGLINHIVQEVSGQPGGLPLLQYALTELFDARDGNTLTLAAYQRSGGVLGALGRRAEQLYDELHPAAQDAARAAFLRMVSVDESADDLRRRVRRAELSGADVDEQAMNEALQAFGAHRLVTFDLDPVTRGPTVEVAHEALLRAWPRLERWIDEQRDDLIIRKRLDTAMAEWREAGEDPSYLPSGSRLTQFDDWAVDSQLPISADEHQFLEAARERDADTQRRIRRRRRSVVAGLTAVAVVLAVAAVFSFAQRREADEAAAEAEDRRLAATATTVSESDMSLGLLLAVEAFQRSPDPAAQGALLNALTAHGPHLGFGPVGPDYAGIVTTDDGDLLVLDRDAITLISPATREVIRSWELDTPPTEPRVVDTSRLSIGGTTAMYVDASRRIRLLDLTDPAAEATDLGADVEVDTGWLSPSGRRGLFFTLSEIDTDLNRLSLIDLDTGLTRWTVGPERLSLEHPLVEEAGDDIIRGEPANTPSAVFIDDDTVAITVGSFLGTFDVEDGTMLDVAVPFAGERRDRENGTNIDNVPGGGLLVAGTDIVYWYDADLERQGGFEFAKVGSGTGGGTNASGIADALAHEDGTATVLFRSGAIWEVERASQTARRIGASEVGGVAIAHVADEAAFAVVGNSGMAFVSSDGRGPLTVSTTRPPDQTELAVGEDGAFVVSTSVLGEAASLHVCDRRRCSQPVDLGATNLHVDNGAPDLISVMGEVKRWTVPWWRADLTVVDPATGSPQSTTTEILGETVPDVVVTTDEWIAFPQFQGIAVLDLRSGDELRWLRLTDVGEIAGAFDPHSERLLIIEGTTPYLLDTSTWEDVELPQPLSIAGAAWNADGSLLVTAELSGRMTIRDGTTWTTKRAVANSRPSGTVYADQPLVFSSDDRYLLGVTNGVAQLWDVATGQQIGPAIETEPGTTPAVAPGANLSLVTAGPRSTLLWNLDISTWADIACSLAGRNMTEAEWNQFGPQDEPHRPTCPEWDF